jgi:hypothetical protein
MAPETRRAQRAGSPELHAATRASFAEKSMREKQAALHLVQLSNKHPDLGLDPDDVETLTMALISEAPGAVISATELRVAPNLPREELLKMQELINRALEATAA